MMGHYLNNGDSTGTNLELYRDCSVPEALNLDGVMGIRSLER